MYRLPNYPQVLEWTRVALQRASHRPLEFVASLSIGVLGMWLIYSDTANISPLAYGFLSTLAPLAMWGSVLVLAGLAGHTAIYYQKSHGLHLSLLIMLFCRFFLLGAVWYGTSFTSNTIPEHLSWIIVTALAYIKTNGG